MYTKTTEQVRPPQRPAQALKHWVMAFRPKTLSIAVAPVLVGSVLAWVDTGTVSWSVMSAALIAALWIQIGTNLQNDAADFERGADRPETRLGPPRVTAQGLLSASQVKRGAAASFALALLFGAYLVWVGGWPILIVGVVSVAAGASYTSGPVPIAYSGFGEAVVCLFFGLVAVAGSYYLQTEAVSLTALLVGLALGLLAAAVLVVNNYRDLDNDRRVGKNTLAVRLGRPWTRAEYAVLMLLPFALLPGLHVLNAPTGPGWLLPLVLLPWALRLIKRFRRETPGLVFNQLLAATAQLQLAFSVVLCLGLLIFDT